MNLSERRRAHRDGVRRRLRELRGDRGWSQQQLADEFAELLEGSERETYRDQRAVSEFERDTSRRAIGLEDIELFARAFGESPLTFLGVLLEFDPEERRQRLVAEVTAATNRVLEHEHERVRRPAVDDLTRWMALASQHMTDEEIEFERERYQLLAEHRWRAARKPIAAMSLSNNPDEVIDRIEQMERERERRS